MKVAAISTFRQKCGVAKYWEELAYPLSKLCDLMTLSEKVNTMEPPILDEPLNYNQCWKRGESLEGVYSFMCADETELCHIQFEQTIFIDTHFRPFLDQLEKTEFPTVITLHNVPAFNSSYSMWYSKYPFQYIVQNELMKQEFLKWNPQGKVAVIPLGSTIFTPKKIEHGLYYLCQVGFYGYDKGMYEIIQAMPKIKEQIPNVHLIFAGSLHPLAPQIHKDYLMKCMKLAYSLKLTTDIDFLGRFLDE